MKKYSVLKVDGVDKSKINIKSDIIGKIEKTWHCCSGSGRKCLWNCYRNFSSRLDIKGIKHSSFTFNTLTRAANKQSTP
jgi:hypothetical protein